MLSPLLQLLEHAEPLDSLPAPRESPPARFTPAEQYVLTQAILERLG